jgi:hypothetical protein
MPAASSFSSVSSPDRRSGFATNQPSLGAILGVLAAAALAFLLWLGRRNRA